MGHFNLDKGMSGMNSVQSNFDFIQITVDYFQHFSKNLCLQSKYYNCFNLKNIVDYFLFNQYQNYD